MIPQLQNQIHTNEVIRQEKLLKKITRMMSQIVQYDTQYKLERFSPNQIRAILEEETVNNIGKMPYSAILYRSGKNWVSVHTINPFFLGMILNHITVNDPAYLVEWEPENHESQRVIAA